jgi:hypothetical protein
MRKILFALSAFAVVITSCDKNEDEEKEVTRENIAGTYKVESMTAQIGSSGPSADLYSQLEACQKDDTQVLSANGTYAYNDEGTECSPSNDATGTWSLPSTTQITMDGDTYTIKSFDGDKLTITDSYTDQGITYNLSLVMDKQ